MPGFDRLTSFVLVVGNARSGSTLLGSILDAHPHVIVANETAASGNFWRGLDRAAILEEIVANSRRNQESGRVSEGYRYLINPQAKNEADIRVMGDKVWNPATLLLHGDFALLNRLEGLLGTPVRIIHAIRNPFDVIATMHGRSGAPVRDRMLWYFMHCDAVLAIRAKWDASRYLDFHHESLFEEPDRVIAGFCEFIGVVMYAYHLAACRALLFEQPRQTRFKLNWEAGMVREIVERIKAYDYLGRYSGEDYESLVHAR